MIFGTQKDSDFVEGFFNLIKSPDVGLNGFKKQLRISCLHHRRYPTKHPIIMFGTQNQIWVLSRFLNFLENLVLPYATNTMG